MANTLQRMQRDGLVRCVSDPSDRRRIRVHLTEHVRAIEHDVLAGAREVNATTTDGLIEEEIAVYLHVTARLIDNLEAATGRSGA